MHGENSLNTDAIRHLAHGEHFRIETPFTGNDRPLINLNTFLFPFDHFDVDTDRVPDLKVGNRLLDQ